MKLKLMLCWIGMDDWDMFITLHFQILVVNSERCGVTRQLDMLEEQHFLRSSSEIEMRWW